MKNLKQLKKDFEKEFLEDDLGNNFAFTNKDNKVLINYEELWNWITKNFCPVEPEVSDDLGRKFIEKAYLYRCNYIRDIDNWEGGYSYLIADSLEEAYELAKILYDKENECIIDIRYIECKKKDDIYGCYMLAPNSR